MSEDTKTSFAEWYEEHGEKYNALRRERYENDPEYRARVLAYNQQRREKERAARIAERKRRAEGVIVSVDPGWKEVELSTGEKAYTIGALAAVLGKSVQSVRLWEKRGVLDETPHRDGAGARLYTHSQIESIVERLIEEERISPEQVGKAQVQEPKIERRLVLLADGGELRTKVYSIGMVANVMGRTVSSLSRLERKGRFPATPLRTPERNQRRFTYPMIKAIEESWKERGLSIRGEAAWQDFRQEVEAKWRELGMEGATIRDHRAWMKEEDG